MPRGRAMRKYKRKYDPVTKANWRKWSAGVKKSKREEEERRKQQEEIRKQQEEEFRRMKKEREKEEERGKEIQERYPKLESLEWVLNGCDPRTSFQDRMKDGDLKKKAVGKMWDSGMSCAKRIYGNPNGDITRRQMNYFFHDWGKFFLEKYWTVIGRYLESFKLFLLLFLLLIL